MPLEPFGSSSSRPPSPEDASTTVVMVGSSAARLLSPHDLRRSSKRSNIWAHAERAASSLSRWRRAVQERLRLAALRRRAHLQRKSDRHGANAAETHATTRAVPTKRSVTWVASSSMFPTLRVGIVEQKKASVGSFRRMSADRAFPCISFSDSRGMIRKGVREERARSPPCCADPAKHRPPTVPRCAVVRITCSRTVTET